MNLPLGAICGIAIDNNKNLAHHKFLYLLVLIPLNEIKTALFGFFLCKQGIIG
jgi:hypothetical protein